MVALRSPCGCEKITIWPTPIQTSYFIGPCNLHYLLFSGIWALLCHHPHCFPSQSQTLFEMGAGRPPITAIARWLFRRENTLDFAGGRGGVWVRCFKHFLEFTYFSRLVKIIIMIYYNHFYVFSFIRIDWFIFLTSWIFILLLVFSLLPLLVTCYCVTVFSNTLQYLSFFSTSFLKIIFFIF